jgi:hypothetical protein
MSDRIGPSLLDEAANRARLGDAERRIAGNRLVFDSLVRHALALHAAGDATGAIRAAAGAARFTYGLHAGVFASEPLEAMLLDLGRRFVPGDGSAGAPRAGGRERVLHVITETYAVGGHTRLAGRWIELDRERTHSVHITAAPEDPPAWLAEAAQNSGGTVRSCRRSDDVLARAAMLRSAAGGADLVVLHIHPFDPVPLLAFADPRGRPPVILLNHADHVFWLGLGVADLVADIRGPGAELTRARRGVAPERSRVLGIPVSPTPPDIDRAQARAQLGLDPSRPVLCTVASAYKFEPVITPSFQELAVGAVAGDPEALLLAVGPSMDARWTATSQATGGRVIAVGTQPQTATLLAAADVYLDSWPCASGTSMLDAALAGLPLVALVPDLDAQGLLATAGPALDEVIVRARGPQEHAVAVAALLADPERRRRLGKTARERVIDLHAGASWLATLEEVVAAARAIGPAPAPAPAPEARPLAWEAMIEALHEAGGLGMTPQAALLAEGVDPHAWMAAIATATATASTPRRAVAFVGVDPATVGAVVDGFRELRRAERVSACVVVVDPVDLDTGLALLEGALAAGEDVDIDVVPAPALDDLLREDDICVAAAGTREERLARARGADIHPVAA